VDLIAAFSGITSSLYTRLSARCEGVILWRDLVAP
jgi:hypothetical protein